MEGARYLLTVVARGAVREHVLPATGRVVIGRDEACDIPIPDASVSRHHAAIEIGSTLMLVDLGSANGTRIAARAMGIDTTPMKEGLLPPNSPVAIGADDCVYLGSVMCTLRREEISARPIDSIRDLARRVAQSDISVLVLGETGVGKEILSESIHAESPRARKPLVRLHCAALSDSLLESELFGHVKGAFTGALRDRAGLIESAEGGTLFLDEIGEMPMSVQVKLLRVLEDQHVQRVGSNERHRVDFRLASATNRDLERDAACGLFRQDLFFRISGFVLRVPPLRERRGEIPGIAESMLGATAARTGRPVPSLSASALEALLQHAWPGNLRELRKVLDRAVVLATGERIEREHLLLNSGSADPPPPVVASNPVLRDELGSYERERIERALAECDGNQTRAAVALGMPRRTLVAKLAKWGLSRPRKAR